MSASVTHAGICCECRHLPRDAGNLNSWQGTGLVCITGGIQSLPLIDIGVLSRPRKSLKSECWYLYVGVGNCGCFRRWAPFSCSIISYTPLRMAGMTTNARNFLSKSKITRYWDDTGACTSSKVLALLNTSLAWLWNHLLTAVSTTTSIRLLIRSLLSRTSRTASVHAVCVPFPCGPPFEWSVNVCVP